MNTLSQDICILVAPPCQKLTLLDYNESLTIILAENDELRSLNDQITWLKEHHPKATVSLISNANHFFHGKLTQLTELIQEVCY